MTALGDIGIAATQRQVVGSLSVEPALWPDAGWNQPHAGLARSFGAWSQSGPSVVITLPSVTPVVLSTLAGVVVNYMPAADGEVTFYDVYDGEYVALAVGGARWFVSVVDRVVTVTPAPSATTATTAYGFVA